MAVGGGDTRQLEVGYHTVAALQGKGYATEAARACAEFAFEELGERHLVAIIHPENQASRRVAEKLGMQVEQERELGGRPAVIYGEQR